MPAITLLIRLHPKGPCTQIVYTFAPKYLNRDYCKAKVYTIWVHGPLGSGCMIYGVGSAVESSGPLFFGNA